MKKIRKLLLLVLCAAFVAVSALFAVACNDDKSDSGDNGGTSGNEQTETTYTVTYALGEHAAADATAPAAATANKAGDYKVTLPAAPAAASGWKFSGWKVGSDVKQVGDEITVSANVTVTAQWAEDVAPAATYTVTYALGDHAATDTQVPPAATATEAGGYKVTLPAAVEAAEGWKFNGWKVGNDVKAAGSEITVSANMTVTADWAEDLSAGVTFAESWQGTWKSQDNATTLVVGTDTLSLNGANVKGVTGGEEGAPYAFSVGGKDYTLEVADSQYSASSLLTLSTDESSVYLAHSFTSTIESKYVGHWYASNSFVEMEVSATGITYDGTAATFVVDAGYFEKVGEGMFEVPIDAHVYLFLVGDELYVLSWSDPNAMVNDSDFTKTFESYVAPDEADGNYTELVDENKQTFSIATTDGVTVVKFNNSVVQVKASAAFKVGDNEYDFTVRNNVLTLHTNSYDPDTGLLSGQTTSLFVKDGVTELSVDSTADADLLNTTWKGVFDTTTHAVVTLTISQEGKVSVKGTVGKIVYREAHGEEDNVEAYTYTVVVGTKVYDVYHDSEHTLYVEDYDGYSYTFSDGKVDPLYAGTYHKNSADTVGNNEIIIEDGKITFGNEEYEILSAGVGAGYIITDSGNITYTLRLEFGLERYILCVSRMQYNAETGLDEEVRIYYLRDLPEYPTVTLPADMAGRWGSIVISKTVVYMGAYKGTVLADNTDSDVTSIFVYANGELHQLLFEVVDGHGQLTDRNYGSDEAGNLYTSKTELDESAALPDKYHGTWADDKGNKIVVDKDGTLYFNGDDAILTLTSEDHYDAEIGNTAWSLKWESDGRICWYNSVFDNYLYFTKLNEVHEQIKQWWTDGTLTQPINEGSTVVVKGLFSGATKGWNGFVVDVNANNAWYRFRMDPAAFGLNADKNVNTWDAPDSMFDALEITGTEWSESDYLALYAYGGRAWVVTEATLLNNKLTYVVKTYAETDSKLEHVVTTTTFVLTLTTPATSLNLAYYFDNDGGTVSVSEAYADTVVRHAVNVTCPEGGSYELSPEAWNDKYFEEGTEVTLSVTAPEGKVIDQVTVDGQPLEASGAFYKFTVDADKAVAITFKEGEVSSELFSEELQGVYFDPDGMNPTKVEVKADSIVFNNPDSQLCANGAYTFTKDMISNTADNEYTLTTTIEQVDASGKPADPKTYVFTITFSQDGTMNFGDNDWACGGDATMKQGKAASFTTEQQGKYSDSVSGTTIEITADSLKLYNKSLDPLCAEGAYTFTGSELLLVGDNEYLLSVAFSYGDGGMIPYTFTVVLNADGSIELRDSNWFIGIQESYTLTKVTE